MVVPHRGRRAVLEELHVGHLSMSKMKSLARMYVWWPGMDRDIERMSKSVEIFKLCSLCHH